MVPCNLAILQSNVVTVSNLSFNSLFQGNLSLHLRLGKQSHYKMTEAVNETVEASLAFVAWANRRQDKHRR